MTDANDMGHVIEQAVSDAIEHAVQEHERGFTLRWIALVESVGEDGTRGLWTMTSPDMKAWDTLGLLEYGRELQRAQIVAERLGDDQ